MTNSSALISQVSDDEVIALLPRLGHADRC